MSAFNVLWGDGWGTGGTAEQTKLQSLSWGVQLESSNSPLPLSVVSCVALGSEPELLLCWIALLDLHVCVLLTPQSCAPLAAGLLSEVLSARAELCSCQRDVPAGVRPWPGADQLLVLAVGAVQVNGRTERKAPFLNVTPMSFVLLGVLWLTGVDSGSGCQTFLKGQVAQKPLAQAVSF